MLRRLRETGLVLPTLLMLPGLAVLVALGTWQWERKAWKDGLLAQIVARTRAAPVPLEVAMALWQAQKGGAEYLRVRATGRLDHAREVYVYAPTGAGPGYHVYTPLRLAVPVGGHHVILVNRGLVPEALLAPTARAAGQFSEATEVAGLLRVARPPGAMTPPPDRAKRVWYDRDHAGMLAVALGDETARGTAMPFYLDAEAAPANPGGWPRGGVTNLKLPNRHLEYALTWWGLAATLIGVYAAFAAGRLRERP